MQIPLFYERPSTLILCRGNRPYCHTSQPHQFNSQKHARDGPGRNTPMRTIRCPHQKFWGYLTSAYGRHCFLATELATWSRVAARCVVAVGVGSCRHKNILHAVIPILPPDTYSDSSRRTILAEQKELRSTLSQQSIRTRETT